MYRVYGDYDVDGITGVAILHHVIRAVAPSARLTSYVPHRLEEGYGLNAEALKQLASEQGWQYKRHSTKELEKMGAGAFLISEFTQVPYIDIVLVSIFPAFLYFGTVFLLVHVAAVKQGLRGLPASQLPQASRVLAEGWHFLLPLLVLVVLLVNIF